MVNKERKSGFWRCNNLPPAVTSGLTHYMMLQTAYKYRLLCGFTRSRLIDGTDVLQEVYCKPRQGGVHEDLPRRGPDHPPVGHHECINDIAVTKLPHNYVISAGRDGVLKIWK